MNILPYYVLHTVVNSIKKLFKTWVAVFLAVCFGIGIIAGVGIGIASTAIESSVSEETAEEEYYEEEIVFDENEEIDTVSIFRGIIILITLAIILGSIYGGDKSGTKIFTMPDVNFLFAAPLSPQSVLMFRTVLQMGIAVASSIYLLFQIPNLRNAGLSVTTCLAIFLSYAFILYLSRLTAVFTYTVTATHEKFRKYIRPFVIGIIIILLVAFYCYTSVNGLGYFDSALKLFSNSSLDFIPIIGWISGLIFAVHNKNIILFSVFLVLLLAVCILATLLIWKIKADFYEDALSYATEAQELINAAQTGETVKRKKERSKKIARNGKLQGDGAYIFFWKTVYNRRRFAKLGIFTPTTVTYTLISLCLTTALKLIFAFNSILPLCFVLLVCIFFRNMGNPLAEEMNHSFIYTVPDSPYKKIYFCLLGGLYETALDLLPAVLIAIATFPQKTADIIFWYILWLSFDVFCSATGLFIELVMPTAIVTALKAMFGLMIKMMSIIPAIVILIAAAITKHSALILVSVLVNLILSAVMLWISPRFLLSGKK